MSFVAFRDAVNEQIKAMSQYPLFIADVEKDALWEVYLGAFPPGTNPMFRERTEHDCNCCKQFIRTVGAMICFDESGVKHTIWDGEHEERYAPVAKALADLVKDAPVKTVFLHDSKQVGTKANTDNYDANITWEHFHTVLPASVVRKPSDIAPEKGQAATNKQVLQRSLIEISIDAIELVLDLIAQNSLYRGEEHKRTVEHLRSLQRAYSLTEQREAFLWQEAVKLGGACAFRNTVIGTLLVDLSEGRDLEAAVKSFEDKVAPHNYKRPTALITPKMVEQAEDTIDALNLTNALERRYAKIDDLTINNVIFADRSAKSAMAGSIFDELKQSTKANGKKPDFSKVEEIGIKDFIENVVPKAESIELFLQNQHERNLVSLMAPVHADAESMFKWGNPFSWSYNGDIADSDIAANVRKHGGKTDGVLRFSIQWNTPEAPNTSDLDAHCLTPHREIYFGFMRSAGGTLDVDIQRPNGVAVENIVFESLHNMPDGTYEFMVKNYSARQGAGFTAELVFGGEVLHFSSTQKTRSGERISVATLRKTGNTLELIKSMTHQHSVKEIWGVPTQAFHRVKTILNSPNHWDGEQTGNKHWFFMLDGCANPEETRGFYNEFLTEELSQHRKVFEVLGSKLKVQPIEDQMSGVGFSSTQRNEVIVKVKGSFNRLLKVKI